MTDQLWLWAGFNVFILALLALDLGVFHRKSHAVGFREAMTWSGAWVGLALAFNAGVWHFAGREKAIEFFTGYVIEKSLSVDNVFVFALLFSYFAVPAQYRHKVLFWGILGALVMRAVIIAAGAALITNFAWVIYLFGAFLILTGFKMIVKRTDEIHPERNLVVGWFKKLMPVTADYRGDKFFVRENDIRMATPLFVVLLLVEVTDLVFAVDSIPAIFAVTADPFIVYTSNVFAILGLRSLYFALAGVMHKFHYLKIGLGVVLTFIGVKMLLAHTPWKLDTLVSLGVVVLILAASMVMSLLRPAEGQPRPMPSRQTGRQTNSVHAPPLRQSPAGMNSSDSTSRVPDESQRLAARVRPAGRPVMYQQWRDLLFLHWEYSVAAIQATLPDGLFVDTFGGKAYLGIVPFFMRNIRPRFLPAVPGISNFMELNLRTYVYDRSGVPGVWFYSLDANQWLAVKVARQFFHLPYEHAKMKSNRTAAGAIRYQSTRIGANANGDRCVFDYAAGAESPPPAPDSLEFFLVERYRLYSSASDGLWRGAVFHQPYPLRRAEVTAWDERLLTLDGFAPTGRPPDHTIMSRGVDVSVFPLEHV